MTRTSRCQRRTPSSFRPYRGNETDSNQETPRPWRALPKPARQIDRPRSTARAPQALAPDPERFGWFPGAEYRRGCCIRMAGLYRALHLGYGESRTSLDGTHSPLRFGVFDRYQPRSRESAGAPTAPPGVLPYPTNQRAVLQSRGVCPRTGTETGLMARRTEPRNGY